MGLFGSIGNFFRNAANKISSTIIKPIGRFVSHTISDVAGKVISAIKSGGNKAIELGGPVVVKGKELVSGVIDGPAGEVVHYQCILMLGTNRIKMTRDVYFIEDQPSKATLKLAGELECGNTSSEEPNPMLN